MKYLMLLWFGLMLFSACNKSDENTDKFTLLKRYTWILDSLKYINNGITIYRFNPENNDLTAKFTNDTYYTNIYGGSDTESIALEKPDKIYLLREGQPKDSALFFVIQDINENHLTTSINTMSSDIFQWYYYHAQ